MKRLSIILILLGGLISMPTLSAKKHKKIRPAVRIEMNVPADLQAKMTPNLQSPILKIEGPKRLERLTDEVIAELATDHEKPRVNRVRTIQYDPLESIIVFITTGRTRRRFHSRPDCNGLANANGVTTTSLRDAYREGRTLCQRCEQRDGNPYPANDGPVIRTVNRRAMEMARTSRNVKNQLIAHTGFTLSYNEEWRISNWVAYQMDGQRLITTVPKSNNFVPDPAVNGMTAENSDYRGIQPYSRGHMAPSADMRWSSESELECNYLSNIVPQEARLNSGLWNRIEQYVRNNVTNWGTVYICTGPIVEPGYTTVGANNVVVPQKLFKVLLRKNKDQWAAIGFVVNNEACSGNMFNYAVPVDSVEALTGHDFFYNLPDNIENVIESSYNRNEW